MPQVFRSGPDGGYWEDVAYVPPSERELPPPAKKFWRLPAIRHVRWFLLARQMSRWHAAWGAMGYVANEYDFRVLDAIRRGEI